MESPQSRSRYAALAAFTVAYMLAATGAAVWSGNGEFGFYLVVMVVLIGAVWCLNRRVAFPMATLWALSAWGLLHMAGGLVPVPQSWPINEGGERVLYSLWIIPGLLKYDQAVHAYGFGVSTWICWEGLRGMWNRGQGEDLRPGAGPLFFAMAGGMGLGAANELVEFAATKLLPGTNVGGYDNTGWDLVANLAGCTIAAVLIRLGSRGRGLGGDQIGE